MSEPSLFTPQPGRAGLLRMLLAQTSMEVRLLLRNGEQLLLTIAIPAVILVLADALPVGGGGRLTRIAVVAPGVLALAVMSTAFTGQAIATGFERRYGVLKWLGSTPLPRWGLVIAKSAAVLVIELIQIALLTAIAAGFGWRPHGSPLLALALVLLGTAAFSGLGLLLAGTLRAETTLAAANLLFVLLLAGGGVIVPLTAYPAGAQPILELLPISALASGLRSTLTGGGPGVPADALLLIAWAAIFVTGAARSFRWE